MDKNANKFVNFLIDESSPYLLQHAHNPVQWHPWTDAALHLAAKENKPLLISIGYSACHWCHVMAHESFEDEHVADIMNEAFICIKVDREERPEIDQIYMDAVILMTGSGGWPLNCFALSDGRPFHGGTYFPREAWLELITAIAAAYKSDQQKLSQYADQVVKGLKQNEAVIKTPGEADYSIRALEKAVAEFEKDFDHLYGGTKRSPKFPMPVNLLFLLRYAFHAKDNAILEFIKLTLNRMGLGGIFDQVGGGFARYATDARWKVPHFEKMLFDNAQLVSLYAEASRVTSSHLYPQVVKETLNFVEEHLTSPEGLFYSSLDADSEGEEGQYYTWTETELNEVLGEDFGIASQVFNINQDGHWKDGRYILWIDENLLELAEKLEIGLDELIEIISSVKSRLKKHREKRPMPAVDTKILTSWNALMIRAYVDAYFALKDENLLNRAVKAMTVLIEKIGDENGMVYHTYQNNRPSITGHLDDYCFLIDALIALYQATFDEDWLIKAKAYTNYVIDHFYDGDHQMFFYTPDNDADLIIRKFELMDGVIPSSNSSMAHNLFLLGHYFEEGRCLEISDQSLATMASNTLAYPSSHSNWALLYLQKLIPYYEVVICGERFDSFARDLRKHIIPNKLVAAGDMVGNIPLLSDERFIEGKTRVYVCVNKTCLPPLENIIEVVKQISTAVKPETIDHGNESSL